jgi:hypothetical protein
MTVQLLARRFRLRRYGFLGLNKLAGGEPPSQGGSRRRQFFTSYKHFLPNHKILLS